MTRAEAVALAEGFTKTGRFKPMRRSRAILLLEKAEAEGEQLERTGAPFWDLVLCFERFGAERGPVLWRAWQTIEGWESHLVQVETDAVSALEEALVRKIEHRDRGHGRAARLSGMEEAIGLVRQLTEETRRGCRLLPVDEAADRARLHRNTIIAAIDKGRLRAKRFRGSYRIAETDLEAFQRAEGVRELRARRRAKA